MKKHDNLVYQLNIASNVEYLLKEELSHYREFAKRMTDSYREQLRSYLSRITRHIEGEYEGSEANPNSNYWINEIAEAKRQLELSDSELAQYIKPREPYMLSEPR